MAVNVLVIPEDFRQDQYVLKPIIEKILGALNVKAKVRICTDPLLAGVTEALKWKRIQEIVDRYKGMTKLFLLIVDRDCQENRRERLDILERNAAERLAGASCMFLAEAAWQELEVWVLAGLKDLPKGWSWKAVRADCDPKETYYNPYAEKRALGDAPYSGRETLAREAAANYPRIRQLCPEDIGALEERIRNALEAAP